MASIMRDDPRRRFVYGFSIDDCKMRLWFASRSDVIVSEPFDFMKVRNLSRYLCIALIMARLSDVT